MKNWLKKLFALGRDRGANAMLELAVGAGVLAAVFAGAFEFGYTFFEYNQLENAVARACEYAVLIPYDSASSSPSSAYTTAVQNMVLYGSPTAGTSSVAPGLTSSNVSLTVKFANGVPSTVTVSITGYTISSIFKKITLTGKPRVTYSYQGIWSPV